MFSIDGNMRKLLAIGVVILMGVSAFMVVGGGNAWTMENESSISEGNEPAYTSIAPLRIDSDSDLDSMASYYGWPGDGSAGNPYIIEGYEIDAAGGSYGLYIGNTTKYFVIRGCHFLKTEFQSSPYYFGAGVELYNLDNGTVEDSVFESAYAGVYLDHSHYRGPLVENNTVFETRMGIYVRDTSNATLRENTIYDSDKGINAFGGRFVAENNTLYDSGMQMDVTLTTDGCVIANNTIYNSERFTYSRQGIHLYDTKGISVYGNTIYGFSYADDDYGIFMESMNAYWGSATVEKNLIHNNSYGIELKISSNVHYLMNNSLNDNGVGIYLENNAKATQIKGNWVNRSGDTGILLNISGTVEVRLNHMKDNMMSISAEYSDSCIIDGNTIYPLNPEWSQAGTGISLLYSNLTSVGSNQIYGGYTGITLTHSDNVSLHDNIVGHCSDYHIYLRYSNWTTVDGNVMNGSSEGYGYSYYNYGIIAYHTKELKALNNAISYMNYGVYMSDVASANISGNTVENGTSFGSSIYTNGNGSYVISGNTVYGGYYGIRVEYSGGNVEISHNRITSTYYSSIMPAHSTGTVIKNNTVDMGYHYIQPAITLYYSKSCTLTGNTMIGGGMDINGYRDEYWQHNIDSTNTVNGEPLRYIRGGIGSSISGNYGQVFVVDSSYMYLSDMDFQHTCTGVAIAYSNDVELYRCSFNGHYNGVRVQNSTDISVYHNNIIKSHASEEYSEVTWYADYPSGGNYWSYNTNTKDIYSGSGQNESGSDGIDDEPYYGGYGSECMDKYPLIHEFTGAPVVIERSPDNGTFTNDPSPNIWVRIASFNNTMYSSDREMYVDGFKVRTDAYQIPTGYNISYQHAGNLSDGHVVHCMIKAKDSAGNSMQESWNFTIDLSSPYMDTYDPGAYSGNTTPVIWVHILDNGSGIDLSKVRLYVNGYDIDYTATPISGGYNISYWHQAGFQNGEVVHCRIVAVDNVGWSFSHSWDFTVGNKITNSYASGWNTVSLAWLDGPTDIETALSGSSWDRAMLYIDGNWYTYSRNRDAKYNAGFPDVDRTSGILVNFTSATTVSGDVYFEGKTTIHLKQGWNLVGYPSAHDQRISDALEGISWDKIEVRYGDGTSDVMRSTDYLDVGMSYWIYVDTDQDWIVEWKNPFISFFFCI